MLASLSEDRTILMKLKWNIVLFSQKFTSNLYALLKPFCIITMCFQKLRPSGQVLYELEACYFSSRFMWLKSI